MPTVTCLILITGSRTWRDQPAIRAGIRSQLTGWGVTPEGTGWLDGGAGGADTLGRAAALELGLHVAPSVTPDWPTCAPSCPPGHRATRWDGTTYCPTAGCRRNQVMVDRVVAFLGRDRSHRGVCLAARVPGVSRGTDDCVRRATAAGIPLGWVGHRPTT